MFQVPSRILMTVRTMASQKRIVAVCQMTAKNDKQSNINICSQLIKSAKEMKAQVRFMLPRNKWPQLNIYLAMVTLSQILDATLKD